MIGTLVLPAAMALTISLSFPAPMREGDVLRERTAPAQTVQDPRGRHGPFYTWHTANQRANVFRSYGFSATVWGRQGEWWVDVQ